MLLIVIAIHTPAKAGPTLHAHSEGPGFSPGANRYLCCAVVVRASLSMLYIKPVYCISSHV